MNKLFSIVGGIFGIIASIFSAIFKILGGFIDGVKRGANR